jgi:hypothetical protein
MIIVALMVIFIIDYVTNPPIEYCITPPFWETMWDLFRGMIPVILGILMLLPYMIYSRH